MDNWREDDARWEAEDEARREDVENAHYNEGHDVEPLKGCWLCEQRAEDEANEAAEAAEE